MAKSTVKEKLYKDALIMIDKLYESDQLRNEESRAALNDLKMEIDVRISLLKDVEKEKDSK